ncbi:NAD(P)-binding protein [Saccharata proteae CBS 121410]|uniref:NAD(P)-binding protein n=1 Tax=Saccharata proteae CBS 121410 TaxID=1314787 RepID=A0A6A5YBS6_9PEZI|nr:NAD(P)-binding protein [Saccharata proteae CBS 121410]
MKGKVIALTGGAQGIGLATAQLLVSRGARVSIGDLDESALQETEQLFRKQGCLGEQVRIQKLDVADKDDVENWIESTVEWAGTLDGAANVAGINGPQSGQATIAGTTDEHWNAVLRVNLTGMFHCLRAELNNIKDGGSIVCTTSVQGMMGSSMTAAYSTTKHGIVGLVKSAAKEMGERNIRVNAVAPGAIETRMVAEKDRQNIRTPIKRLGKPEECAHLIAFLLSDDAAFITGSTYPIDGGWTS